MKTQITEQDKYAEELTSASFLTGAIETYEDIDADGLVNLGIFELRCLARKCGVFEPLSKTQDELIAEITEIAEREIEYYPITD